MTENKNKKLIIFGITLIITTLICVILFFGDIFHYEPKLDNSITNNSDDLILLPDDPSNDHNVSTSEQLTLE